MSSWSRSAASPAPRDRPREARDRGGRAACASATTCACPDTTGCMRSATSTAESCSRTWASTRAGSSADSILGRTVELRSDGGRSPRVIFTDPQVGAVGLTLAAAAEAGITVRHVDVETSGNAGGSFVGHGAPRDVAAGRRRAAARRRRRDDHRAPRSPRRCTRPRSRSSPRCRSTTSGTPCRHSRRAASCGCACSRRTGSRSRSSPPARLRIPSLRVPCVGITSAMPMSSATRAT